MNLKLEKLEMYLLSNVDSLNVSQPIRIILNAAFLIFYTFFTRLEHIGHSLRLSPIVANKGSMITHTKTNSNLSSYKAITNQKVRAQSMHHVSSMVPQFDKNIPIGKMPFRPPVQRFAPVTIIIPAYNEQSVIGNSLFSLMLQSQSPASILVVDDFSSDDTGEIAKSFQGVTVLRAPKNSGSKGHALNYALPYVESKYTITIDADMTLESNAIEKMVEFMESNPETAAASSFVLPKMIKTHWERSRYIEYLFSFSLYKKVQHMFGKVVICSGCFTCYKTNDLKSVGGWPTATIAEDMDLTWLFYERAKGVGYNKMAFCYATEPGNFRLMAKQLKRWNTGFCQVLKLRWKNMLKIPVLREFVVAGMIDALMGPIIYPILLFTLITAGHPLILALFFAVDVGFASVPPILKGYKLKSLRKVAKCLPSYFLVRFLNSFWFYYGFLSVFVFRKSIQTFEKGHV